MRKGFISYSHADRGICDALFKHLGEVNRTLCRFWRDPELLPGSPWNPTIGWHINRCHVAIVLVSSDAFKSGGFIPDIEVPRLNRRVHKGVTVVLPATARAFDPGVLDSMNGREVVPLGPNKSSFILGPNASEADKDNWCAAVVSAVRRLLESLPPIAEHEPAIEAQIRRAQEALRHFELCSELDEIDEGLANDIEKQISGVKATLRAPAADFWYLLNAIISAWRRNVLAAISEPALFGAAILVCRELSDLERAVDAAGYDWPPDQQRAEHRGLLQREANSELAAALDTAISRVDSEAQFLAQPGRTAVKAIAHAVTDTTAIARAVSIGPVIDGKAASTALQEADQIAAAAKVELSASVHFDGGTVDFGNVELLRAATIAATYAGDSVAQAVPAPPSPAQIHEWEIDAALRLLDGRPVAAETAHWIRSLKFDGLNTTLFNAQRDKSRYKTKRDARLLTVGPLFGIEKFYNLEELDLDSCIVGSTTHIGKLASLKRLYVDESICQDFSFVSNFRLLEVFLARSSNVRHLDFLSGLTRLEEVSLRETDIRDLSPLTSATGLRRLYLAGTKLPSLSVINNFRKLEHLDISGYPSRLAAEFDWVPEVDI